VAAGGDNAASGGGGGAGGGGCTMATARALLGIPPMANRCDGSLRRFPFSLACGGRAIT